MKEFPLTSIALTKVDIEHLLLALTYITHDINSKELMPKLFNDTDYILGDFLGFQKPLDKQLLITAPESYSHFLFGSLTDTLWQLHEAFAQPAPAESLVQS